MVVSTSKMSIAYYLSTVAKGDQPQATTKPLTAYYTETATPPGRWWGHGLTGLSGIASGQEVGRGDAIAIYDQLADPVTGQRLCRAITYAEDDGNQANGDVDEEYRVPTKRLY